jgi:RHS repeat-associated protein
MGRDTNWRHDIQGRVKCKEYADGSNITYIYDNASRLRQRIDGKLQVTQYNYNRDNTVSMVSYTNATVSTPTVTYTYDPNYSRISYMIYRNGSTIYTYNPISPTPTLGAGRLASIDGPEANDTITYIYDELGRCIERGINGVISSWVFDAANRVTSEANVLGKFDYTYDGPTHRRLSANYPNGLTATFSYLDNVGDRRLERVTYTQGATPISEFSYSYDVPTERIATWSQKSGTQPPLVYSLGYDAANQLTSATASQSGNVLKKFAYIYDLVGNRLTEQIDGSTRQFSYNALNELTSDDSTTEDAATYQWDAEQRLVAAIAGTQRTEFTYDGIGRRVGIRQSINGSEVRSCRFVWCDDEICEERTSTGAVAKRFFTQGVKVETGTAASNFYYVRDHLGSIWEVSDSGGNIRARYSYDPFGRQTRLTGDLNTDFGFAGMFRTAEASLNLTKCRAYDPDIGRWLSRDPLENAELAQGYNLYVYGGNDPVNKIDPTGTMTKHDCTGLAIAGLLACGTLAVGLFKPAIVLCFVIFIYVQTEICDKIHDPDPEGCSS